MKRGLILRPTFKGSATNAGIDPQLLRKIVLYWDILEYPFVNGMSPNYDALKDMKLLKDSNIIESSYIFADEKSAKIVDYKKYSEKQHTIYIRKDPTPEMKMFWNVQVELMKKKNYDDKNTLWSIADLNDDLSNLFLNKPEMESVLMEFYNFLPVPTNEVEMEDILEFKSKRKDELLYLRSNLDELNSTVSKAENLETEIKKKKEDIEKSLLDLHRILDENKFQKVCSNLNIYLNLGKSELISFIASSATIGLLSKSLEFGLLAAFGVNIITKIGQKKTAKIDDIPDRLKGYMYAYNVEKKFT